MNLHPDIAAVIEGRANAALLDGDAVSCLPQMPAGVVDAVITDPPYSSGGMTRGDRVSSTRVKYQQSDAQKEHESFPGDNRDQRSWLLWCSLWLGECLRVSKPGALLCVFTDWRQLPQTTDAIQCGGWVYRGIVPWNKVVARPMAGRFRAQCEYVVWGTNGPRDSDPAADSVYLDGFFEVRTVPTDDREHATQKPVELMQEIVRLVPPGGLVLDPFAGTGTTGVAARQSGLRFVGCEMSEHYAAIARRRIADAAPLFLPPPAPAPAGLFAEGTT
jgi:site-specific DNA-methyltransferase (adenine-specific)